jgi:DNA-binding response OmpR family regulator
MDQIEAEPPPSAGSTIRYPRVLVVEDEPQLRMIVRANLEHRGVEVTEAGDAAEAIDLAMAHPDLILLDINLPDRTGWDVLRELRAAGSETPTVVVSAVRVPPGRLRDFGVIAYLPKPFPIDALVRLVVEGARA